MTALALHLCVYMLVTIRAVIVTAVAVSTFPMLVALLVAMLSIVSTVLASVFAAFVTLLSTVSASSNGFLHSFVGLEYPESHDVQIILKYTF